jgi:hypothetical protein
MKLTREKLEALTLSIHQQRDALWTSQVLGITGKILTPQQAALWLHEDRVQRARFKGHPKYY